MIYINPYRFSTFGCDSEFANVVLLLPLTGANNSTTFTDASYYSRTITRNGGTIISTAQSKFGGGSAYFDGDGDYLRLTASTAWAFGTGDFTIECWVYQTSAELWRITNRLEWAGASGTWGFNINTETLKFTQVITGEPGVSVLGLPSVQDQWAHYAVSRAAGVVRLFRNGVIVGSGTDTTNYNNSSYALKIGVSDASNSLPGYMSDLRITKGTARYTADFAVPSSASPTTPCYESTLEAPLNTTVPFGILAAHPLYTTATVVADMVISTGTSLYTSNVLLANVTATTGTPLYSASSYTAPLSVINTPDCDQYRNNVSLLMHFEAANGSTTFTDSSVYAQTVTSVNSASHSTLFKKFGNSSLALNGVNNYITVPDGEQYNFGTGDFTIEFWIKTSATGLTTSILSKGTNEMVNFGNLLCRIGGEVANKLTFFCNPNSGNTTGRVTLTSLSDVTTNQWILATITRSGNNWYLFINGNLEATQNSSVGFQSETGLVYIGCMLNSSSPSNFFNGYIDELRITKGVARYTSNFVPQPAAFSEINCSDRDIYWSAVVLQLPMNGANASTTFTDVSSSPKTVTRTGDTKLLTTQAKWGGASGYFDGSGDFLSILGTLPTALQLGSGDFTIEFYVYTTSTATQFICGNLNDSLGSGSYWVILNSTYTGLHTVQFGIEGTSFKFGSTTLETNTWQYIAMTRSGTSLRCFLNGTQIGTTQTLNNFTGTLTNEFRIASATPGTPGFNYFLNGYLQDLRITKGVARYTSNFSVPTAAFPTAGL